MEVDHAIRGHRRLPRNQLKFSKRQQACDWIIYGNHCMSCCLPLQSSSCYFECREDPRDKVGDLGSNPKLEF